MHLVFLKLGGSLITDKTRPYKSRPRKLKSLAGEISSALAEDADLQIVLGHGSGSFGHTAASRHSTRQGVSTPGDWRGFAEVWYQASTLNRLVIEALYREGLPVVTFSPAASLTAKDGKALSWDLFPLQAALSHGLLPVIHGDVVLDKIRGGTILSTEELFAHLAYQLHPERILLAGLEAGVWSDFPSRKHLLREITPENIFQFGKGLGAATGSDVTGGMFSKITEMLTILERIPDTEILIFSGDEKGNLRRALLGENPGTRMHR